MHAISLRVLRFVQTNSPTLARQGDGLRYIRFGLLHLEGSLLDGAPSPYKWYQSHVPNLACVEDPQEWMV